MLVLELNFIVGVRGGDIECRRPNGELVDDGANSLLNAVTKIFRVRPFCRGRDTDAVYDHDVRT
jgi:hypothetical protein